MSRKGSQNPLQYSYNKALFISFSKKNTFFSSFICFVLFSIIYLRSQ